MNSRLPYLKRRKVLPLPLYHLMSAAVWSGAINGLLHFVIWMLS